MHQCLKRSVYTGGGNHERKNPVRIEDRYSCALSLQRSYIYNKVPTENPQTSILVLLDINLDLFDFDATRHDPTALPWEFLDDRHWVPSTSPILHGESSSFSTRLFFMRQLLYLFFMAGYHFTLSARHDQTIYTSMGIPGRSTMGPKHKPKHMGSHPPLVRGFTLSAMKLALPRPPPLSSIVPLIYPRRRKRSPAVIEQRNDSQEAMSQTLDSYIVPTKPPKRRHLTKEERLCVAHVRKMKACPSCWQKHLNVQNCVFFIVCPVALCAGCQFRLTHLPLKTMDRRYQLQTPWRRPDDLDSAPRSPPSGYGAPHTLTSGYSSRTQK